MFSAALVLALCLVSQKLHYVLMFAHQDAPYGQRPDPHTAHSFASWVEVEGDKITDEFTISWCGIHGVKFLKGPQPGRQLTLEQSLDRANRRCLPVTMWGPFRICDRSFERARCIHSKLDCGERTGTVQYNVLDWASRSQHNPQAINCIHVLTDVAVEGTRTGTRYGISATEFIIDHYVRCGVILGEDPSADWIWEALRGGHSAHRRHRCSTAMLTNSETASDPESGTLQSK